MEITTVRTSFGIAWTDGRMLLCNTEPLEADLHCSSEAQRKAVAALAEELWAAQPPETTIAVPDLKVEPCDHPKGLMRCGSCNGSGVSLCYACDQERQCEDCDGGVYPCSCLFGFKESPGIGSESKYYWFDEATSGIDHPIGIKPAYVAAAISLLGPITKFWLDGKQFRAVCERGRAIIMSCVW